VSLKTHIFHLQSIHFQAHRHSPLPTFHSHISVESTQPVTILLSSTSPCSTSFHSE
jgi:hypothetical protein